jgi:hypothetical protein
VNAADGLSMMRLYAYCQEMVRNGKRNGAFVDQAFWLSNHAALSDPPRMSLRVTRQEEIAFSIAFRFSGHGGQSPPRA